MTGSADGRRPSRRAGRRVAAALAVCAAVVAVAPGASLAAAAPPASRPPSFVVVMTDDQTLEQLRVMDITREVIGEQGTTFANFFVGYSLCCPSRSTFMSGQHAHNHGTTSNLSIQGGGFSSFDFSNALGVWLQDAGYVTAHIGKQLNEYGAPIGNGPVNGLGPTGGPVHIPPGYDEWFTTLDPSTYSYYNYWINHNNTFEMHLSSPDDYQTDVLADHMIEVVEDLADDPRPFFIHFAPLAPHVETYSVPNSPDERPNGDPPDPAPRHEGIFDDEVFPRPPSFDEQDLSDKPASMQERPPLTDADLARIDEVYRGEIGSLLAVDEAVGRLVETLEATGRLDDTVIVFMSDNGLFHGEHRVAKGKVLAYEESVHVPLLVRGPGFPAGVVREQVVSNVDVPATIVAMAGATPGRTLDGVSLLPVAGDAGHLVDRAVLIEADIDELPAGSEATAAHFVAVRTARWKLIVHETGELELYDLVSDPFELESQHASPAHASVLAALRVVAEQLRECVGDGCVATFTEPGDTPPPAGADVAAVDEVVDVAPALPSTGGGAAALGTVVLGGVVLVGRRVRRVRSEVVPGRRMV